MKKNFDKEQIKKQWVDTILYSHMLRKHEHYMVLIEPFIDLILMKIEIDSKKENKLFLTQENVEKLKYYPALEILKKDKDIEPSYGGAIESYIELLDEKLGQYSEVKVRTHDLVYYYVLKGFKSCELKFKALEEQYLFEQNLITTQKTNSKIIKI